MNNMKRNRVVGILVVAFALLLIIPALLSHSDESLAKLKIITVESNAANSSKIIDLVSPESLNSTDIAKKKGLQPNIAASSSETANSIKNKKAAFELASLDGDTLRKNNKGEKIEANQKVVSLPSPVTQPKKKQATSKSAIAKTEKSKSKKLNVAELSSTTALDTTIQVASLTNQSNAQSLLNKLRQNNLPSYIKHVIVDQKRYTRVMVGPFKDDKAKKAAKVKLTQLGY